MSIKKLIAPFVLMALVLAFATCVLAAEFTAGSDAVCFVNNLGADTNAGTTADAPFKTLSKANKYLRELGGGTVVISGEVVISSSFAPSDVGGAVIYTSKYGGVDYRESGAVLALYSGMAFNSDTYFENVTFSLYESGVSIVGRCHNLAFGYGVQTVNAENKEGFNYPVIIGGYNGPSSLSATSNERDYAVHIYSGDWYGVYGGSRRNSIENAVSNLAGNVSLVIKGGTFQDIVSATGMSVHSGNVYFEISGGTFNGTVVPIRRLGTMPENPEKMTDAEFSANVLVRISGGTFNGRFRLAESTVQTTGVTYVPKGDATVVVTGGTFNSDFTGYGVVGSVLLKYKEGVLAEEKIKGFPAWKTGTQDMSKTPTEKARFLNPIGDKADPYIVEKDGIYYYCFSSSVNIDGTSYAAIKIAAHGSVPFGDLTTQNRSVFNSSQTTISNAKREYWAPELHYFDAQTVGKENAGWYIYFAADDGENKNHRMYVLRATDPENPLSDYEMVGKITDSTDKWAIDGTVLSHGGSLYFIWSGWEGDTNVAQNIYVAKMSNPWTVSSERVMLSKPEYSWETQGNPDVNEGPQVLKAPDGTVHIVYSASGSWSRYYCYGVLTLTGDDPLNASHWYKATSAKFSSGNGMYGPGHGSFVQDDGGEWWMIYHANASLSVPSDSSWWAERSVYTKQFSFKEMTLNGVKVSYPDFGTPAADGGTQFIYVRTADYHSEGDHHYGLTLTESDGSVTELYRACYICGAKETATTFASAPVFELSSNANSVEIVWGKVDGADGYRIYRRDAGDDTNYERLAEVSAAANSYTDENLEGGTRYRYLMHAFRYDVNGEYQYVATGGKEVYTALATPTLYAKQTDANVITLTIAEVANATEYVIYRSVDLPIFKEYATVTSLSYADTDVMAGSDYGYKVIAKNANAESGFSESVSVRAKFVGASLEKITSGALFDSVSARAKGSAVSIYKTAVLNAAKELVISDDVALTDYIYSVHGDYVVPALEYERADDDHYMLTFMHGGADAYIFSECALVNYGDTTADGKISLFDVLRTLKYVTSSNVYIDVAASDVNFDCVTDVIDVAEILRLILN